MSEQTADMLERALRRNHSGNWPLVMPSDLLALVEAYRRKDQRIADLERERALLLAYIRANEAWRHHPHGEGLTDAVDAAMDALIDAGLLGGEDETARQEAD